MKHEKYPHFYEACDGWFWFGPAYAFLLGQLPTDRRSVWVEIGVYKGRSLAWLGVEALRQGKPVEIHAVDLVSQPEQGEVMARLLGLGCNVHLWHGDSAVTGQAFQKPCDVVWVDGDHSYEGCTKDIEAWWPHVKPGGWIGGDDLEMAGVERAVRKAFPTEVEIGYGTLTDGAAPRPYPYWLVRKPI